MKKSIRSYILKSSIVLLVLILFLGTASAATITVGESGKDHTTITDAVAAANLGDIILVSDGIYNEVVNVNNPVTIISENGSASTVIQASGNSVFTINADNVTISGFNIAGATNWGEAGIEVSSISYCNISDNLLTGNYYAIYLDSANNNTLTNNTVSSNDYGIYITYSSNYNTLINNTANNNSGTGIFLSSSSNYSTFTNNTANNNSGAGIFLNSASNNNLTNNTANNNFGYGIYLSSSSNNILTNNTFNNNSDIGIILAYASNNTLNNNIMSSNTYNFKVYGVTLGDFLNDIDQTNFVDDKPIYYWVTRSDEEIPSDAGLVCVVNSTNITVRDLELTNGFDGVLFAYTSNSIIQNVTVSENNRGVHIQSSSFNVLDDITVINNKVGLSLNSANNNILTNNTASNNSYDAFSLSSSNNNILTNNTASNNSRYGIYLSSSSTNTLTNNTFSNNSDTGIYLNSKNNYNTLTNNTASNNSRYGIFLSSSSNNTLTNNTFSNNSDTGIYLGGANNNILTNNTFSNNSDTGIYLYFSNNYNTFANNTVSSNDYGINLFFKNNYNNFANNTAIGNNVCDLLSNCENTLLSNYENTVENLMVTHNSSAISLLTDTSEISVVGDETHSIVPADKTNVNGYVDIVHSSGVCLNVTFSYDDSGMSSIREASVELFRLNGTEWVEVPNASLNTSENYVSINLSEFGTFGLFSDPEIPSPSDPSDSSEKRDSSVARRIISEGTTQQLLLDEDGEIMGDTVVKSSDSKATATLFKGTVALSSSGDPLNKVMITMPLSLPADVPKDVTYSGLYYDFEPSGSTFNKDVMITMDFDPKEFESTIPTIYTYTSEDGWVALDTAVDRENGRATAMVCEFSVYALFGTDVEDVNEVIVATPAATDGPAIVTEEEIPVKTDTNSGYLYFIAGLGIVLVLGIFILRNQKDDGGL
ncbi:right-handed parallel beta-helix repeat-containing protein [Methanococcoides orientis]|uniref:NosD domain-containing protein n=1 Tax=Methanococcoides orientis TaxID=2822137 RepID=UPI001E2C4174|nr:NosD domain-containing protein [Methanococcoides orientis]UGV41290.1 right-handed parallel beta-helix repeat-containing protein [Methanococcoides orientis]